MDIKLFSDVCLFDNNKTIIYGQYTSQFTSIEIKPNIEFTFIFCSDRNDFYIEINNNVRYIDEITFINSQNIKVIKKNIFLYFPFENCKISLNPDSAIISTMCKDYSSRLEEWIEYNLKLGFSGIIIFDNDGNKSNNINEPLEFRQNNNTTIREICKKYKDKVFCVRFNYTPFVGDHYDNIQRITLHIGVNFFRNKCEKITLIDADEFIHIPNKSNIIEFLSDYKRKTLTIQSNILTNKSNNDVINNNILDLCLYVGEDKYTKTMIDTSNLKPMEFIITPHNHPSEIILNKNTIIYYHCWVNSRYSYNENMSKIESLNKNNRH
jgi:hypothetical protein